MASSDKLHIDLHGGKYLDRTRYANLTFYCDPSSEAKEPISWNYRRTETEGILSVEYVNKWGCPLNTDGSHGGESEGGREGAAGRAGIGHFFKNIFLM